MSKALNVAVESVRSSTVPNRARAFLESNKGKLASTTETLMTKALPLMAAGMEARCNEVKERSEPNWNRSHSGVKVTLSCKVSKCS